MQIAFIEVHLETGRIKPYSGAKVQSPFYPGDSVTRTGDREIRSVSGRLPHYPRELACMYMVLTA